MTAMTTPTQGDASARGEDVIEPRRIDATTIHSGLRGHAGTRSGRPSREGQNPSHFDEGAQFFNQGEVNEY